MSNKSKLSEIQKNILRTFYSKPSQKLAVNKSTRNEIWKDFVKNRNIKKYQYLEIEVPAFFAEMNKALIVGKNLQPAIFSECVYAQSLATHFELPIFSNISSGKKNEFHNETLEKVKSIGLQTRYIYSNIDESKIILQAGGANSVDCAMISKIENNLIMIEFKEQYARTSEPDLPKYKEDGFLISTPEFEKEYPQFKLMLEEQITKKLNIFEHIGKNEGEFSTESIEYAVLKNYAGSKFADVICTEDDAGYLVMLPTEHASTWAKLEGEIRPSGRNSYKVWSLKNLLNELEKIGAEIQGEVVTILKNKIKPTKERGGARISRYKINPLFFIRTKDIKFHGEHAVFKLGSVRQLNPSITAKMNFKGLKIDAVKKFYSELL